MGDENDLILAGTLSSGGLFTRCTGKRILLNNTVITYNEMNHLLIQQGDANYTYTYDEYGNCITKNDGVTTWEYHYDDENRLSSATENGEIIEQYVYDGDGKRIKKIDSESVRIYIYSGINVLYEIDMTTQMNAVYIYGPTGRIAKEVNNITEYYHTDHLGSTRLTTSETGAPITEVRYEPFGEQINITEEQYTYNGKELDVTGLYYYGARYYDPETGRFLTRDPLPGGRKSPQTLNRYVYCLNNPLKYMDLTGNQPGDPQETVEEIFERLQNIDPDTYLELQEQVDSGAITALEALKRILELLGYYVREKSDGNSLEVRIDDNSMITVKIDNTIGDWGNFDTKTSTASINFEKSGNVADMTLIVLHEISHAVLGGRFGDQHYEHQFIYSVERSYIGAFGFLGVEYSKEYREHILNLTSGYDLSGLHQVPIPHILERWLPRLGHVVA